MTKPWLTFDCYDTLIRYSENKAAVLADLVRSKGGDETAITAAQKAFEASERKLQLGEFMTLNAVLRSSLHTALTTVAFNTTKADEETIIDAVKNAEPFPDVRASLADLKHDHRLAVISNSEPDIIRHNIQAINVEFDAVVLATQAKCYKPNPRMFFALLARINEIAENVTHIAQSFYHDMRTSRDLGFGRRIWINRYGRISDPAYSPDAELPNLYNLRNFLLNLRE